MEVAELLSSEKCPVARFPGDFSICKIEIKVKGNKTKGSGHYPLVSDIVVCFSSVFRFQASVHLMSRRKTGANQGSDQGSRRKKKMMRRPFSKTCTFVLV